MNTSIIRLITLSTTPPKYPALAPRIAPTTSAIRLVASDEFLQYAFCILQNIKSLTFMLLNYIITNNINSKFLLTVHMSLMKQQACLI